MKKSVFTYYLPLLFVLLFSTVGCKDKHPKNSQNFDYSNYVYNHTSGLKSTKSVINITLSQESDISDEEVEKALSFSPSIKGVAKLINNKGIVFTPSENLKSNTDYSVSIKLNKLFPNQKNVNKDYTFSFKTKKQDFEIKTFALQSYNQDWQYITGEIKTNDVTSLEKVKQILTATQENNKLSIKFDEINIDTDLFLFKIDSIYRKLDDSNIQIKTNGNSLNIDKKQERDIQIPGKNNFKVVSVKVVNDADQYVEINFSDPVAKGQNLKGLITIQRNYNLKYSVNGNVVKVYANKTLKGEYKVHVFRGVKNVYGYKFKNNVTRNLSFDEPKPQVKFSKSGNILPNSEGLNIQFKALNLKAVDVTVYRIFESNVLQFLQKNNLGSDSNIKTVARPIIKKVIPLNPQNQSAYSKWQTYGISLDKLIEIEKGAIYRVKLNFNRKYSTYKCDKTTSTITNEIKEETFDGEDVEKSNWDNNSYNSYYDNDYYNYSWSQRKNPCSDSYYRSKSISKNILATDIGLTVKKGNDNSYFIATNNIVNSEPLGSTHVEFYNFQQQVIAEVTTDQEGIAKINLDKIPFFITAKKDGQTTYIKVNDGNVLSMSNFNTNGSKPLKGIKGFIYNERGVWRPGDTIFTAFMLNDHKNKIPKNHPVTLELKDPNGVLKYRKVSSKNTNQLYTFKVPTKDTDPTGKWNMSIVIGGASFNKSIKIETIKPNRLKIKIETDKEILTSNNKVNLSAKWLHGAIAKELKVVTELALKPQKTKFKNYSSYIFDDPSKRFETEQTTVLDAKLDADGKINFNLNPKTNLNAPGMLKAYLTTKVYEDGGDFSTDVFTKTYAPFNTYVGLKRPQGDKARNMLLTDKQHLFELVCVNVDGEPSANKNLSIKIYKMNNSWWYNNTNSYSQFNSSTYKTPVFEKTLTTKTNGKTSFNFEIKYPEWGRYFVQIIDKKSGHSTGETVFIDWPGWAGKSKKGNQKEAAMLVFTTDKDKYQINDKVSVDFPSSKDGNALITIENNEKVLKHYRVKTNKESTNFKLSIDKNMTPNVYISISTLQPHHNTKNDLPIRMYGIKSILVEDVRTHLNPVIETPKQVEPEKEFKIKVSEKNNSAFTYTIAIVDEGLLDLTRYKTPNPWTYFNAKEALGIKTWDIYDDVIGAFGGKLNQVFSIGGDQDLGAAKTQKANRFKPVVIFKGPFTLEAGETKTHKIKLPKYIGAVKAMIVAHNNQTEAYGKTSTSILVKKPLMLLASAPRKVSKDEKITIPVTIFNALENNQLVNVKINTNDVFSVIKENKQRVSFNSSGDKIAYFDLKVVKPGYGKITIEATNRSHKASYEIEINSFNPIKEITKSESYIISENQSKKMNIDGFGVKNTNTGNIEISSFPQINFSDRLKYLIKYPHGCLEQTVSAVFPQLYINNLFETSLIEKNNITNNINNGLQKLSSFQLLSGGFSYWPGSFKTTNWATNYAGHFLLEAENQGYLLPYNLKTNWVSYQKETAKTWRKNKGNTYLEQAYRLYTLALAKSPELSVMNRLRENPYLTNIAKLRLALAYAIIGQKEAATQLINDASLINYSKIYQVNHRSTLINKSIALQTYQALGLNSKALKLLQEISKELNADTYLSTKTTSMSLLAIANYYKSIEGQEIAVILKNNGKKDKIKTHKYFWKQSIKVKKGANSVQIKNERNYPIYVRVSQTGIPEINQEESISKNLITNVNYIDNNGKKLDITNLSQGTSFIAEIEIKNVYNKTISDIALTYQIPSGWEILNTRYATGESETKIDYSDIRDNAVYYYMSLNKNESKKFKIRINTTYLGSYYLPGIHAEAMYNNEYLSHTKGKWINVVP